MLTLKKVKELVEAPVHTKRVPSPKVLLEEGLILMRKEFDHGSHLTVYQSGYVLFSAGKRNTVFHIHDCCGDYSYDAAAGRGDVIREEYFENCEWHIRALFEGERKMEESQWKCEGAGQGNVCVSYHAVSFADCFSAICVAKSAVTVLGLFLLPLVLGIVAHLRIMYNSKFSIASL